MKKYNDEATEIVNTVLTDGDSMQDHNVEWVAGIIRGIVNDTIDDLSVDIANVCKTATD